MELPYPTHLKNDYAECRRIMREASKNYTFSSNFLPFDKRPHVESLYAVLRVGDDRVDVSYSGFSSPQAAIEDWQDSYWKAFETGNSQHPVLRAYLYTAQKFQIPAAILAPYFRSMLDDLRILRFPKFNDLIYYMEGSAIPVGRAMCHILGTTEVNHQNAYPAADSLSIAMQLSNFWRDIGEDWRRGRVYIPQEDLNNFSYTEEDIRKSIIDHRLIALLEFEFERTMCYFHKAESGIKQLKTGRWGVMSGLAVYRAIIHKIRQNHYDVFSKRARASTFEKLRLVIAAWQQVNTRL